MPVALKALLIAVGVVALLAGGTALAYRVWWQTRGADIVATLGDGTRYGESHDRQGCVTEAVLRLKRASGLIGFTEQVQTELFLGECLKTAAPVEGFCTGVPPQSEVTKSAAWRQQTSARYGLEGTLRQGLVREIQQFCSADAGTH